MNAKAIRKLRVLADALPPIQCDSGCGECCGPAMCTDREYREISAHMARHGIKAVQQGIVCPMYQRGACAIYAVRPLICRTYGHFAGLPCGRGYRSKARPESERKILPVEYVKAATRCVHEMAYSIDELDHEVRRFVEASRGAGANP